MAVKRETKKIYKVYKGFGDIAPRLYSVKVSCTEKRISVLDIPENKDDREGWRYQTHLNVDPRRHCWTALEAWDKFEGDAREALDQAKDNLSDALEARKKWEDSL